MPLSYADSLQHLLQSDMEMDPGSRAAMVNSLIRYNMSEIVNTGNLEDIREFLQQNPSLAPRAVWHAASNDQIHVVQYLVGELRVHPEPSALEIALRGKALRCVAFLTFMGVPLPQNPTRLCLGVFPPLAYAARRGQDKVVKTLLSDKFCRLEDTDPDGMTALAWAVRRSKWVSASLLVQAGAWTRTWKNGVVRDVEVEALVKKSCPKSLKLALVCAQPKGEMRRLFARVTLGMPVQWSEDEPWAAILSKVLGKDGHDLPGVRANILRLL